MITREVLLSLGEMEVCPLATPSDSNGSVPCIGCWKNYEEGGVVFCDFGPVCLNCLKYLADSYFDK